MGLNFLNLDTQGAEHQALNSLLDRLAEFDYLYLEVDRGHVYKGIKQFDDLDTLLGDKGFSRVATCGTTASWDDALYARKKLAETEFGGCVGVLTRTLVYKLLQ